MTEFPVLAYHMCVFCIYEVLELDGIGGYSSIGRCMDGRIVL
jgi:hypothetical protein